MLLLQETQHKQIALSTKTRVLGQARPERGGGTYREQLEEAVSEDLDVLHVLGEDDDRHNLDEADFDAAAHRRKAGGVKREPDHGDGWSDSDGADEPGADGNRQCRLERTGMPYSFLLLVLGVKIVRS
jgi:hypothetical protein